MACIGLSSHYRKLVELVALSAALGTAFLLINFLHFHFLAVKVILYACVWDALAASILVLVPYGFLRLGHGPLLTTEFALVAIASNLMIILYAVMGPTVIDRSLSIYIVQKIDQRGGRVAESAMRDIFVKEYLPEFRLVDVRMTEQVTSGTVEIENGCIILTPKGRRLSVFADFYRNIFLPRRRYLMGEVTDQLTDPFANAKQVVDTTCPGS
tara:strand:- start:9094 stop:9729 length:636 start_codon:yes stop_codon:yes gene_type:complete